MKMVVLLKYMTFSYAKTTGTWELWHMSRLFRNTKNIEEILSPQLHFQGKKRVKGTII